MLNNRTIKEQSGLRTAAAMGLVFAAGCVIYGLTRAPTVTAEDSGELACASYFLGIAHPPGFPLWCILAKGFTYLPFGNVAERVTVFSVLCTSLTGSLVCLFVCRLFPSRLAGIAGGLVFLFGKTIWSHAVVIEVYPLNALFVMLILVLVQQWLESGRDRLLLWISFLAGLGLSNHPLLIFLLLPSALLIVIHKPALLKRWGFLTTVLLVFALGLLPYLYLPIRSAARPEINWGRPTTFQAFLSHITRSQYTHPGEGSQFTFSAFLAFLKDFLAQLPDQYGLLLTVLALAGLFALLCRRRKTGALTLSFAALSVIGPLLVGGYPSTSENFSIAQAWYQPAYMMMAVWAGAAYGWFSQRLDSVRPKMLSAALMGILFLPVLVPLWKNYCECDKSRYFLARDHALSILDCMEPDAIYFPGGDYSDFAVLYLQLVEGIRPDVVIANYSGSFSERFLDLMRQTALTQNERELLESIDDYYDLPNQPAAQQNMEEIQQWEQKLLSAAIRLSGRPIYYYSKGQALQPGPESRLLPHGLVFKVCTGQEEIDSHRNIPESRWTLLQQRYAAGRGIHLDYFSRMILFDWTMARLVKHLEAKEVEMIDPLVEECKNYAGTNEACYNNLGSCLAEHGFHQYAYPVLLQAVSLRPDNPPATKNLAVLCLQTKRYDQALNSWQKLVYAGSPYRNLAEEQISKLETRIEILDAMIDKRSAQLRENPDSAAAHNNLGAAYAARGWGQKAVQEYEDALQIDPNHPTVYRNLIQLYSELIPDPQKIQEYRRQLERISETNN